MDYSLNAKKIINELAQGEGRRINSSLLEPEHILLAMLKIPDCGAMKIMNRLGINFDVLRRNLDISLSSKAGPIYIGDIPVSPSFNKILKYARDEAIMLKEFKILTEHLLLGLFKHKTSAGIKNLIDAGINYNVIVSELKEYSMARDNSRLGSRKKDGSKSSLADFTINLNERAQKGLIDGVIGRESEIERVIQILGRKNKNNPVLVGEAGVGKTVIVEGLAKHIVEGTVPEPLLNKIILSLDMTSVVAGTKYRGEFEDRLKKIMAELREQDNIILFIDELHSIIGAGAAEGALDAANILKPVLARGELQCVGATTLREHKKYIEKDPALERRFQTVLVNEPSVEDTIEIILGLQDSYEKHHKVNFTPEALKQSVYLSDRYINDRFLPDKAIDVIDEAGSRVRLKNCSPPADISELEEKINSLNEQKIAFVQNQEYEKAASLRDNLHILRNELEQKKQDWEERRNEYRVTVEEEDVIDVISAWSGVNIDKLSMSESERLLNLEDEIHKKIVGQDEAVRALCGAIRRSRTGFRRSNRPIGAFVLAGPTGVGKTELAKVLAEYLFGNKNSLIRLDMSEFMEKHSVSRLVGAPPGYVGYEEGGQLTEKVKRRPYCVILLDEIEKAHPDFMNIMLQVLDEGELTDNMSGTVSFRDTIIIMTSNLGNSRFDKTARTGFLDSNETEDTSQEKVREAVKGAFNPEFINRIDEIVCFHHLEDSHILKILDLMLSEISGLVKDKDVELVFTAALKKYLADKGMSRQYGARYLRKVIQDEIEDALALEILRGGIPEKSKVTVSTRAGKVTIKTKKNSFSEQNNSPLINNEKVNGELSELEKI
ncbi:MAG: ATP-dependent Clp protease ATP-binding subunit [Spirochaetes bacterium]|nr:ATP-dependent Clp protease ATP-binding subunit [Spirochaetota bacterium]MBN2769535.1 ATP-dependent Clp protease ATP-binding subunit [Spirochaetota bacterium]